MSSGNPFDAFDKGGLFDDLLGPRKTDAKPKEEKSLPWNAKHFDGKLYLPLEQVIELLKMNDVLPKVRKGLERHL